MPALADVAAGTDLPATDYPIRRADLVRYAGASGDLNPIHWSERTARAVGLPDVIAHGMLTMALAGRYVTDWAGDPAAVLELGTKFTRPVVVPDDDTGTVVTVAGRIAAVDEAERTARIDLTATCHGAKVLAQARATVRLR